MSLSLFARAQRACSLIFIPAFVCFFGFLPVHTTAQTPKSPVVMVSAEEQISGVPQSSSIPDNSKTTPDTESRQLSTLSASGFPVQFVGSLVQYQTQADYQNAWNSGALFSNSGGVPVENGKAFLTWYASVQRLRMYTGQTDGDQITVRAYLDGQPGEAVFTWYEDSLCWDNPDDPYPCLNPPIIWSYTQTHSSTKDVQWELLYNGTVVDTKPSYHIYGYTLEGSGSANIQGEVNTTLSTPLKVKVVDYDGVSGVTGEIVKFSISTFDTSGFSLMPSYSESGGTAKTLEVITNAEGIAEVYIHLGNTRKTLAVSVSSPHAPLDPPHYTAHPLLTVTSLGTDIPELDEEKNKGDISKEGCIGNPINVVSGNKFEKETDLVGLSASPLAFTRYYNATEAAISSLGQGWRHTYDRSITITTTGKGQTAISKAFLKRPDGRGVTLTDSGNGWVADADVHFQLTKKSGKWELRTDEDTLELYNGKGQLVSITDTRGNTQTLSYNNQKAVSQVASSSGEKLGFTYDGTGKLINLTYWAANPDLASPQFVRWSYGYGSNAMLTTVTLPDARQRSYHYEDTRFPNALTGITDERDVRYATWVYDNSGNAITSYHGDGAERRDIRYGILGERIVKNSLGQETRYGATAQLGQGMVTGTTGPTCSLGDRSVASYIRDPLTNNLISKTIDGVTTEYGNYDARGNRGYEITAAGTPLARRVDYSYDLRFHNKVTRISEPSVHSGAQKVTTMDYDATGSLIRKAVTGFTPDGDAVSSITTFEYTGPYHQLSRVDGPRANVADVVTLEYYPDDPKLYQHQGMPRRVVGPNGLVLRDNLHYNAQRQLVSETRPNGLTLNYVWQPGTDRLASLTETVGTQSRTTHWTYLPSGEIETITLPGGTPLSFGYDEARRLTRIADAQGNHIDYRLDGEGNILDETTRDAGGTLRRAIVRSFDAYNRLDGIAQANELRDYDFNADGTLAREVNGRNVVTEYGYDDLKRLATSARDAEGSDPATAATQTVMGHDGQDNLTAVTDPNNATTRYEIDDLGNRVSTHSPDTGTTTEQHDSAGNPTRRVDAKGQVFTFTHDALNRPIKVDGPGTEHDLLSVYDTCANGLGRLCEVSRGANTTTFAYNGFGELTGKTETVTTPAGLATLALTITRDTAGRIAALGYPGNTQVLYHYDNLGNIERVSLDRNGQITTLASQASYLPFGPLTAFTFGNGLAHTLVYDDAYRLTAINDPVYASDITHDSTGNIVAQVRTIGNLDTGYDALDRLITATDNNQSLVYQYDRNGNRLMETRNGAQATYSYQPGSNRITQTGVDPVSLDANGNTTQLRDMSLVYSPDNRLIEVVDKARYSYNAMGERIIKTTSEGITSLYLYGPEGQLLAELDGNGQPSKLYAYLNGQPLVVVDNTNGAPAIYYSHNDHLGTSQAMTNQSGGVVWTARYDPFGLAAVNDDPDGDSTKISFNLRFPGQYLDEESGLHYNYFRDYDPSAGRYIQSDPVGLQGGINTYGYVLQNPLRYIDPTGKVPIGLLAIPIADYLWAGAGTAAVVYIGSVFNDWWDNWQEGDYVPDSRYGGYSPSDENDALDLAENLTGEESCALLVEALNVLENRIRGRRENVDEDHCGEGDEGHEGRIRNLEEAKSAIEAAIASSGCR